MGGADRGLAGMGSMGGGVQSIVHWGGFWRAVEGQGVTGFPLLGWSKFAQQRGAWGRCSKCEGWRAADR